MLPFFIVKAYLICKKGVFTFYIEWLKVIKRYEMRNENGNCHSKNERDTIWSSWDSYLFCKKQSLGIFNEFPFLYVIGGKDLPNRRENKEVDEAFAVALKYLYKEYSASMLGVSDWKET